MIFTLTGGFGSGAKVLDSFKSGNAGPCTGFGVLLNLLKHRAVYKFTRGYPSREQQIFGIS